MKLAEDLSLDHEGFEFLTRPSRVTDFYDDDQIERVYHPEIEALLVGHLRASRVAIFDATRRSDAGAGAVNKDGLRRPASHIHVDYTVNSCPQRVIDLLGTAEARRLAEAGKPIVQVNVWRPIRGPVERAPLAVADASTIRPESLVATDQVYPDRIGEIYHLTYDPAQRWYYAPRMTADEVLLLKGWDSRDDGRARFTRTPPSLCQTRPPRHDRGRASRCGRWWCGTDGMGLGNFLCRAAKKNGSE